VGVAGTRLSGVCRFFEAELEALFRRTVTNGEPWIGRFRSGVSVTISGPLEPDSESEREDSRMTGPSLRFPVDVGALPGVRC